MFMFWNGRKRGFTIDLNKSSPANAHADGEASGGSPRAGLSGPLKVLVIAMDADTEILETALKLMGDAFDQFLSACIGSDGKPIAPDNREIRCCLSLKSEFSAPITVYAEDSRRTTV
jgi:hypothetical protein